MPNVLQQSFSRGTFRSPVTGISTADVRSEINVLRPNPVKIGFSPITTGNPALSQGPPTGDATYGEGSLYFIFPTPDMVNLGLGLCQIWINTGTPQPTGVGTWLLFYSVNISQAGGSGGGADGGSGGGDGGD